MGKRSARSFWSPSSFVALGMVLAAGAIAWYGMGLREQHGPPPAGETVTLAAEEPPANVPSAPRSADGLLPTRVVVPAAGIDASIDEVGVTVSDGTPTWETAWRAAGHHLDSARPGQPGNLVLTGHVSVADTDNLAVFATLDDVQLGDVVDVYAGEHLYQYRVTDIRVVTPDATRLLRSDHRSLVTLITCTHDLRHRLVVTGELI